MKTCDICGKLRYDDHTVIVKIYENISFKYNYNAIIKMVELIKEDLKWN